MIFGLKDKFEEKLSQQNKTAIALASECAENFGINIYLIGGVVRDLIMNNKIKDIDIAAEGNAIDFCRYLENNSDAKITAIQENLKTVKVLFSNGVEIDFASTRQENYTSSGTLPVAHNFGCELKEDVKRRDFTINTLAIKLTGEDKFKLIDYFKGYFDIENKKIKILHKNSFIDDPSRIIRALKFKVRFDFDYENETYNLMQNYLENPNKNMPLERIKSELKQYFSTEKDNLYDEVIKTNACKLISDNPIIGFNIDNLNTIAKYNLFKKEDKPFIYLSHLIVKSDFNAEKLNLNSYEKRVLNEVKNMLNSDCSEDNDEKIYKEYFEKEALSLAIYYIISGNKNIIKYLAELKQIKILSTGQDLIEMGLTPSKYFAEIFDKLLKEKLKGNIKTKEEELLFVEELIKKESR